MYIYTFFCAKIDKLWTMQDWKQTQPSGHQPSNPTVAKNSVDNLKVPEKEQNFDLNAIYKYCMLNITLLFFTSSFRVFFPNKDGTFFLCKPHTRHH